MNVIKNKTITSKFLLLAKILEKFRLFLIIILNSISKINIVSIIFNIVGTHQDFKGLFDKISFFKCLKCNKYRNNVIMYEDIDCICLKCLQNN